MDLFNTEDLTSQMDPADINANKAMGGLSYFGILCLIPLLAAKDSQYAKFHANYGLILFIGNIICNILRFIPHVGKPIAGILSIVIFVLAIMGLVNGFSGKAKQLPLIKSIQIIK